MRKINRSSSKIQPLLLYMLTVVVFLFFSRLEAMQSLPANGSGNVYFASVQKNEGKSQGKKAKKAPVTQNDKRSYDVIDPEFRNIGPGFGGKNALPFWISVVVLLIAIGGLIKSKKKPVKLVMTLLALIALGIISYVVYWEARSLGRQQGYAPVQPIWFSHKVHVTQNGIDCEYCHVDARTSRHAGIPSLNVCLNCHNVVKKGKRSGTKEISKIYKYLGYNPETSQFDKPGHPIQWIKVHNLPDFVYFNHAQHVQAGKVKCQECHGPVERMNRIVEYNEFSMKFCLDCHRKRHIITDNQYYSLYKFHLKPGQKPTVKDVGGTDCSACHY